MTEHPAPPYPADTRAKGWRFELDYEKIEQSDTWDIANEVPLAQQCLLLMWYVAWKQVPCGSMPADEATIRAKCKVPAKLWPTVQPVLMRGWWLADDGRLYHDTIVARVNEMLEYRRKTAERVAKHKAAQREQHDGNALPPREQQAKNDTGTGTGTITSSSPSGKKKAAPQCVALSVLVEAGFSPEVAAEFMACKAQRKAPLTARAWADHVRESAKAGWSVVAAAEKVMAKTWKGFEAKYVADEARPGGAPAPSFRERDATAAAARVAEFAPRVAARPSHSNLMETVDVTARLVG